MCGIVGLFLKDQSLYNQLGNLLSQMLLTMSDRGPDSAGVAVYGEPSNTKSKITVQSNNYLCDFEILKNLLKQELGENINIDCKDSHAVIRADNAHLKDIQELMNNHIPNLRIMSTGHLSKFIKRQVCPAQLLSVSRLTR